MLNPNEDRVVIELATVATKSKGGLYIPPEARQKPIQGRVVAAGKGKACRNCGLNHQEMPKVGEFVIFPETAGTEIFFEGKEYRVLRATDIFGADPDLFGEKSDAFFAAAASDEVQPLAYAGEDSKESPFMPGVVKP